MAKKKAWSQKRAGIKHGFRSGFEEDFSKHIKEAVGQRLQYEKEKINYVKPETKHTYTPDFILKKKDGSKMYVETKGRWVLADRKKHKLLKEQHPALDIRIVFQNPNQKIRKGSKTTYGMWADKLGIPWHTKTLDESWIKELK